MQRKIPPFSLERFKVFPSNKKTPLINFYYFPLSATAPSFSLNLTPKFQKLFSFEITTITCL